MIGREWSTGEPLTRASVVKLPTYPEYKSSGVEWLGQVPVHWVTWKVTHGFRRIGSGTTPRSADSEYYGGDIPWVTTSELRETVITDTKNKVTATALYDYPTLRLYPKGTLLFALYGATIGRLGILGIAATLNQACAALAEPLHLDTWFVYYWLQMRRPTLIALSAGGGQPNLRQDDLRQLRIPAPSLDEQHAIANFLDRQTATIDTLIAKKRTIIERLKEKRATLISHTVTRGLPPDAAAACGLEPHVRLKPSGIEWLGEIPEHWDMRRLKMAVHLTDKKVEADEEHPTPYVGMENIESWTGRLLPINPDVVPTAAANEFNAENTLFGKLRPYLAKAFNPDFEGLCSTEFLVLTSTDIHRRLLLYILLSDGLVKLVDSSTFGSKMPRASWDFIGNCVVPIAPMDEQRVIADFLDSETATIDSLVAKTETAIERVQEYRAALITAAVTGKIDAREAAT